MTTKSTRWQHLYQHYISHTRAAHNTRIKTLQKKCQISNRLYGRLFAEWLICDVSQIYTDNYDNKHFLNLINKPENCWASLFMCISQISHTSTTEILEIFTKM